jgi:hypothetical protein
VPSAQGPRQTKCGATVYARPGWQKRNNSEKDLLLWHFMYHESDMDLPETKLTAQ